MTPVETSGEQPNGIDRRAPAETLDSILCVDDDPSLLAALQRQFRKTFRIETAISGEEGLAAIARKTFAVVVSDLRMPGMNGIQFLAAVRARAPDTVRVMLTGQADMSDAIAAVNQGAIFRFLLKPSSAVILGKVIESALEQHRLIVAERQLTQQTLVGCVEVLSEVLSIVEPVAFSRTTRVLRYVRQLAGLFLLRDSWQVEAAAMLSQIGWITIPTEIANKVATNQSLSGEESRRFSEHPSAAARIIERIPRLEIVAKIIEAQLMPCQPTLEPGEVRDPVHFGAAILHAAIDFDERRRAGMSHADALADMRLRAQLYHPEVIAAMTRLEEVEMAELTQLVPIGRLAPGMILEQDICIRNGVCLIGAGQQITATVLERLRGFWHTMDAGLTVSVRVPEAQAPPS
ncbi:MAG TPA: HD domain-containing phosphohydrolase [Bryobacteraceae bacterium]|jgi:ActR/RegA family two-component response regulator|nr:HD domain-containing phosphohydrolase [Bryobacteraceae bacterium]